MEVILKFVSPDLSEIGEVESYDPFGASRLLWILCRNFKIQVATLDPSLNHTLTALIGDFSKICREISGVYLFFQKLFQVLKTGEAMKGRLISENVLASEIIA